MVLISCYLHVNEIKMLLAQRDGRTQEALAGALGVSSQAVSRWEASGGYPDMEMLPSIANYFNITIDELFGYEGERNHRINIHKYTAPLVSLVNTDTNAWYGNAETHGTEDLPNAWPMWLWPLFDDVKTEIIKDPRWDEWVKKTKL